MINSYCSCLLHFGILTLGASFLSACTQSNNSAGLHVTKQSEVTMLLTKITNINDLSDTDEVTKEFHLAPTPKLQTTFTYNNLVIRYYKIYENRPLELGSDNTVDYEARESKSLSSEQKEVSKDRGIVSLRFKSPGLCIRRDFLESMWGEGKPMFNIPVASSKLQPTTSKSDDLNGAFLIPISLKQVINTEEQPFGFTWKVFNSNDGNFKLARADNIDQECFSRIYFTQSDPAN